MSWKTMEEYKEDDEFGWEDPNKVDNDSLWRVITIPEEFNFFLLQQNQLHFGQLEHESTPFTTEIMQQKFDWNTLTDKAEEVLNGTYDSNKDAELKDIMQLVLTN